ncbi:MAG TPA: protease pro-enzyme activation domain-containing protein [Bryobacteraceae bacterium]|nr:protease pro-enzyme activation domain-containing protein [Bryobacteraceae bacterium]
MFSFSGRGTAAIAFTLAGLSTLWAGPPDRIREPVGARRTRIVPGNVHLLAQAQYDQGPVDPAMPMNDLYVMIQTSAPQQTALDQLMLDQQNPASPRFHRWLTPEQFGSQFGLSSSDESKVVAWLNAAGFTVKHLSRAHNWIAFAGTAAQVTAALHTPVHRFQVNGEMHFANTVDPAVPEALAGVVGGFLGLNNFRMKSTPPIISPDLNSGTQHFLSPGDFATIYDVNPLYQAGINGNGVVIAVVGDSDVLLSDLAAFRSRYGLSLSLPKLVLWGTDPGFNGDQIEGNLDLEWASAIAPNAAIDYVYGIDAFTSIVVAVELNQAQIITASYGYCEINFSAPFYRSVAQQANAQGITLLSAAGDSGPAGCQDRGPSADRGQSTQFPASLPEVTAVGGTEFAEGSGDFWAAVNSSTFVSALSYIPEMAWNESSSAGIAAGGGGASSLYSKPAWQSGPGVPADGARDVPDIALSASIHDAYYIYYQGANVAVGGTSASAPSMAGIVALLNQYLVTSGVQKQPGLGNINAQLYRLAQSAPSAFHDIVLGNTIVPCEQGSPNCTTGSFGYRAAPGYDLATGLGSIDANQLVTNWNMATSGVTVTLTATPKATVNDSIQLTATVAPASGSGTPTGTVNFVFDGVPLGSGTLSNGTVSITFPAYVIGLTGTVTVGAGYSGDATFSPGGGTAKIQLTLPAGAAAIVPSAPNTVWAQPPDAQGLSWQTAISLNEIAGVPAMLTGFTLDGQAQSVSQYFPSASIPGNGSITATFIFRNLSVPVTRVFVFNGVDANGNAWSRQVSVAYQTVQTDDFFTLSATPLTIVQNTSADPSCQWSVQLNVDDYGGFGINLLTNLFAGGIDRSGDISAVFGTDRLDAWDGLQGTLCFSGITPPATDQIEIALSDGIAQEVTVSFASAPQSPATLTASPASLSLAAADATKPAETTFSIGLSDKTQTWTAAVYPANRTTSWLSLSQLSGTGPAQITVTASGAGFEPAAYRATIVIQSPNTVPQFVNIPVVFVLGGSATTTISAIVSSASFEPGGSPGMEMGIFGTQLANTIATASGDPLPYSTAGVSVTVNGLAAPVLYASPGFLNIQVPYAAGAGPAVVTVNNNGQVAGMQFTMAPSAPGVFADAEGNLVPTASIPQGGIATLYMTGAGEISPALKTAYSEPATVSAASLPKPVLPLSVTIGNVPVFLEFVGLAPTLVGTTVVNFLVPSSVPMGTQPLVVTVNGVASKPVNVNILPLVPGSQ